MDHLRFKSEQTAAAYVANGLDAAAREEFELHLMSCTECVEEVESWRALKGYLPRETQREACGFPPQVCNGVAAGPAPTPQSSAERAGVEPASRGTPKTSPASGAAAKPASASAASGRSGAARWRLAASLAAGVIVGAAGGWYGRTVQGPSIQADNVSFYSLPPLTRGPSDCTSVRVDSRVALLAVRVPAAAKEQQLVAVDSEGHDLAPEDYAVSVQADGSWLVRLRAGVVRDQGIRFEARSADGTVEPRGCVLSGSPG